MNLKRILEEMKDNMPYMVEVEDHLANLIKIRFDSLIKSGFTEEQALVICQSAYPNSD